MVFEPSQFEKHEQLVFDGVQVEDIKRLRGDVRQQADRTHIENFAEALGWLVTSYAIRHREMPQIRQVNGVDQQGLPIVRFELR